MREAGTLILVATLFLLPVVGASSPLSGELQVEGEMGLEVADVSMDGFALWVPDSYGIRSLSIVAESARMAYVKRQAVIEPTGGVLPPVFVEVVNQSAEFDWHDIKLDLVSEPGSLGYFGVFYARNASAAIATSSTTATARAERSMGNAEIRAGSRANDAYSLSFGTRIPGNNIEMTGAMQVVVTGDLVLKLVGPDVRVDAVEGSQVFETESPGTSAGMIEYRWLYLELSNARMEFDSGGAAASVAGRVAHGGARGIRIERAVGEIQTPDAVAKLTGQPVELDGEITFSFTPAATAAEPYARTSLAGVLDSTSAELTSRPALDRALVDETFQVRVLEIALVFACVLGAVAAFREHLFQPALAKLRKKYPRPGAAEEIYATLLAMGGSTRRAAYWTKRALRLDPARASAIATDGHLVAVRARPDVQRAIEEAYRASDLL